MFSKQYSWCFRLFVSSYVNRNHRLVTDFAALRIGRADENRLQELCLLSLETDSQQFIYYSLPKTLQILMFLYLLVVLPGRAPAVRQRNKDSVSHVC